jgi:hypothetical protein
MTRTTLTASALALAALAGIAQGNFIRFTFTGTIDYVVLGDIPNPPTVLVGDTFVFSYTFNTLTPDHHPDPNFGSYMGAILECQGQVGIAPIPTAFGHVSVLNDARVTGDRYEAMLIVSVTGPNVNLYVHLNDHEAGAFTSDALPHDLSFDAFDTARFTWSIWMFGPLAPWEASGNITGFSREAIPCYADCNADRVLTVADFGCFQTRFVAGEPYADCNGVSGLTIADFACFQTAFVKGCP